MKDVLIDLSSTQACLEENDITSPVLYETSDVDEEQTYCPVQPDNDNILAHPLKSVASAKTIYENDILESNFSDFSGKVGSVASFKGSHVVETRKQKLVRIKRELLELQTPTKEDNLDADEIGELNSLQRLLEDSSEELRGKISDLSNQLTSGCTEVDEVRLPKIEISSSQIGIVSSLEARIADLERRLGNTSTNSLSGSINDLHRRLNLLSMDERKLSSFQERLQEISDSYEKSIVGRHFKNDPNLRMVVEGQIEPTDEKIKKLYSKYDILKKYSKTIPQLTKRIESLQFLHSSVHETSSMIENVNAHMSTLDSQIKKWSTLLESVQVMLRKREKKLENTEEGWSVQLAEINGKLETFR